MTEKVTISLTTTTALEHHSGGKLSSSYTTTIPFDVPISDAQMMIRQIADEIETAVKNAFESETQQRTNTVYRLTSVTRDKQGDRYCFNAEYTAALDDFVLRFAEGECEVDI